MTDTDPKLLAQAKKGDAIALQTLLNASFQGEGIWAQVSRHGETLQILLESTQPPDPQRMEQRLRIGLARLKPQGIQQVMLQGQGLGDVLPQWERTLHLDTAAPPPFPSTYRPPIADPSSGDADAVTPIPLFSRPSVNSGESRRPQSPPIPTARPRSPVVQSASPSSRKQPWVLKWSDFDPMMLGIMGLVAVYGFLGARNPGPDGPFLWLHLPDLAIHETGHLLFMPFGHFWHILGGSLTQILFPAVFTIYFCYTQQFFSSALTLFWTGQNFMDVGVYMRDAPYRELPLTVDNIDAHDWWQLFTLMNCLDHAELIANITHAIGVLLYLASVVTGIYVAYHTQQTYYRTHPQTMHD